MSRDHTEHPTPALTVLGIGLLATMAAFLALVVAGIAAADLFPATGTTAAAAADRGVWMATQAWANPLAITGVAALFGLAIPLALRDVRSAIDQRRDALVTALPTLITNGADR